MRILGIDPGLARMGWGIVEDGPPDRPTVVAYGCITTPSTGTTPARLWTIAQQITGLLTAYRPEGVALERLFFGRNVTTALAVGEARGVVLSLCGQAAVPVIEFPPATVKLAVTGSGRADKGQVQDMITHLLRLPTVPKPDDTADALAIAWIGWAHSRAVAQRKDPGRTRRMSGR